ncbi:MAG: class I tRNA ligase family protein [Candidatus Vogelbacteria bacterium]|nr:class I tRNA ligase family protein [Candidatus Vogelbacteria bacterium]
MKKYNHRAIEKKWQNLWALKRFYQVNERSKKEKYYALVEFPYPSGEGLHVGHIRSYTAMDVVARKRRAEGYEVLYPMGWDAFGLPTENYAIKTGQPPALITRQNINRYRKQLQSLGFSFDWSREINTSDPDYYKWTQWMFLQFFKAGLAYKAKMPINWCPSCKIGLANEEVADGKCERCGRPVEAREKEQWLLKITQYADRLDRDLDLVDYPAPIKIQQRNWIANLHDWIFSRQRYWGEPIPLVFCAKDGWVAVPDKDLPVKLPKIKNYQPTDTGESPLAAIASWVNTKCPKCAGPARRETDTMPNWAGSSWYYLAYLGAKNLKRKTKNKLSFHSLTSNFKHWLPVDWYNGGMEHTTLHLLYSRFWHKALYDLKLVPGKEPYAKRTVHGLILAAGGEKMSKSRGNVVNPDAIVKRFGADTLRVYEMFMGPFDQAIHWNEDGLIGARRFLERVYKLGLEVKSQGSQVKIISQELKLVLNQTVQKVSNDIEQLKFNTAISALMILLNDFEKQSAVAIAAAKIFLKLLSPFAPHLAEELWQNLGEKKSIHLAPWPRELKSKNEKRKVKIVIQINGKTREVFETGSGLADEELKELALSQPKIKLRLTDKTTKRIIIVPNRLINIVLDKVV